MARDLLRMDLSPLALDDSDTDSVKEEILAPAAVPLPTGKHEEPSRPPSPAPFAPRLHLMHRALHWPEPVHAAGRYCLRTLSWQPQLLSFSRALTFSEQQHLLTRLDLQKLF